MDDGLLQDLFSLNGRVAIVTGASSGIGRELAIGLARAGGRIALGGRDAGRLEATRAAIQGTAARPNRSRATSAILTLPGRWRATLGDISGGSIS